MDKVTFAPAPLSNAFFTQGSYSETQRSYGETLLSCWEKRTESESCKSQRGVASKKWQAALNKRIADRLPPEELKLLNLCKQYSSQGREASASEDMATALRCFAVASSLCIRPQFSAEGRLLALANREAAEAYLDFCCNDFDQAAVRIERALSFNAELEHSYSYELLFAQRIHLIGNLVRIRAFSGKMKEAMKLASDVLIYLSGQSDEMPGYWVGEQRHAIDEDVIEWQMAQVLSEVALLSGIEDSRNCISDLNSFFFNSSILSASHLWSSELREWFLLKKLFLADERERFLHDALLFLEKGQQQWPLFWFTTLVDAARASLDDESWRLREELGQAARTWNYVPRAFRGKLLMSRLPAQSAVEQSSEATTIEAGEIVLISFFGSMGDLAFLVRLGQELSHRGYPVTLIFNQWYLNNSQELLRRIKLKTIGLDRSSRFAYSRKDWEGRARMVVDLFSGKNKPRAIIGDISARHLAIPAKHNGIPFIVASPMPFIKTREFYLDSPYPCVGKMGWFNLFRWKWSGFPMQCWARLKRIVAPGPPQIADSELRERYLNLFASEGTRGSGWDSIADSITQFVSADPLIIPKCSDWNDNVHVLGSLPWNTAGWEPSDGLLRFLSAGAPPLYVCFGSFTALRFLGEKGAAFLMQLAEAARAKNVRMIFGSPCGVEHLKDSP